VTFHSIGGREFGTYASLLSLGKVSADIFRREFGHFELVLHAKLNEFSCALGQVVYQEKLQSFLPGINPE
jgi:hypothetical protein